MTYTQGNSTMFCFCLHQKIFLLTGENVHYHWVFPTTNLTYPLLYSLADYQTQVKCPKDRAGHPMQVSLCSVWVEVVESCMCYPEIVGFTEFKIDAFHWSLLVEGQGICRIYEAHRVVSQATSQGTCVLMTLKVSSRFLLSSLREQLTARSQLHFLHLLPDK